jgi:hypothetical protein
LIELPIRDPCDLCEVAGREERWAIIDESEHTLTVINPLQFEVGQCCVITRRHVATLLDLSERECGAILVSAKRVAEALVKTYSAGRQRGTSHDPSGEAQRRERVQVSARQLAATADLIRSNLPK